MGKQPPAALADVPRTLVAREPSGGGVLASVVPLGVRGQRTIARPPTVGWTAVTVAAVLAVSPLRSGYFDFSLWGAVALGSIVLLAILVWGVRPTFSRPGLAAGTGLGLLLVMSAASLLWAESKEAAWTAVNRLAFYGVLFTIMLLAVRDRRTARLVIMILGSAALLTSFWLCVSIVLGGGQHAFLTRRLNAPMGYINGTAGLLVMGIWPWLACAEIAPGRIGRAGALAAASLIASTLVLTQSRAIVPAAVLSAAMVVLCTGDRARRAVNLIIVATALSAGLPWTLAVYARGGAARRLLAPEPGLLRAAVAAIVVTAVAAGFARVALSMLADRLGPEARRLTLRGLGRALALGTVVLVGLACATGGPWIARQYRSFTALRVDQNAQVRFVDASGFRYDLWRVAVREFASHPVGGLGAGSYDLEYYRLRRNPESVMQPHSLELQMAAELGVGGVAALLLFCGATLWAACARVGTLASEDRLIRIAATGMFAGWLAGTSVDWLYDIPGLTGMAIIAAALIVVPAGRRQGLAARGRSGTVAAVIGLALLAVLAASVGRQYVGARYAQAGVSDVARTPRVAIGALGQASRIDPYALDTYYSLAAAYARLDDYPRARAALLLASAREPHNYVPPALLGDLAMRRGDYRLAASEYGHSRELNPRESSLRESQLAAEALAK